MAMAMMMMMPDMSVSSMTLCSVADTSTTVHVVSVAIIVDVVHSSFGAGTHLRGRKVLGDVGVDLDALLVCCVVFADVLTFGRLFVCLLAVWDKRL
jgi:hypothetical protein